jgi:hypothetical protein
MSLDHGVVGGTLKSMKIDKIHKIHAPNIQGRVFSEKKCACGRHIDHGVLGGTLKSTKIDKRHLYVFKR